MSIETLERVAFEDVKPLVGSIVRADKQALLTKDVVDACRAKLDERGVLVIPQIFFTDEEQLAFTDLLGNRLNLTSDATTDKKNDVYKVTLDPKINKAPEYALGTFFWHMDGMPLDMPPPRATLLSARKVSATGGQTEFAHTAAAYDGLTADEKAEIENLRVIHTVAASLRVIADLIPDADKGKLNIGVPKERPLVATRASGRRCMIIGSTADRIVGMEVAHGRALLARLVEWSANEQFSYRHQWQEGDFVVWDNCSSMHRARPYDATSGRMMHRTSIAGDEMLD